MLGLAHHQRTGRDNLSRPEDLEDAADSDALLGAARSAQGMPVESPSKPTLTEIQKTASAGVYGAAPDA